MIDSLPAEQKKELSPAWLEMVQNLSEDDPWLLGFTIECKASSRQLGQCGFKGPPDESRRVEIAYGIDDAEQGKGYATEAALSLVKFAKDSGEVDLVLAHTLPNKNASTRVLEKCKFEFIGTVEDPEDGTVWRWQRLVSES